MAHAPAHRTSLPITPVSRVMPGPATDCGSGGPDAVYAGAARPGLSLGLRTAD